MKKEGKQYIIGVIGPIASGKDAASNWFVDKYGFKKIVLSNFLRQEARKHGIYPSRQYLRKLQAELRKTYGYSYLIDKAIEEIKSRGYEKVVIDGLRHADECSLAKKKLKAKIILVDADPFVRFMRAKKRKRKGFAETYEQFLHQDAIENATFDFHKTKKLANFKINNAGDLESLQKVVDKLAKQFGLKRK
jgi:dephospho-CoA kinase